MKRSATFQRLTVLIAGVSAVALLLPLAAPHRHEPSASDQPATCRAFCVQDGWAASAAAPAAINHRLVFVADARRRPSEAPRVTLVPRRAAPRAPPVSS